MGNGGGGRAGGATGGEGFGATTYQSLSSSSFRAGEEIRAKDARDAKVKGKGKEDDEIAESLTCLFIGFLSLYRPFDGVGRRSPQSNWNRRIRTPISGGVGVGGSIPRLPD